MDTRRRRRRSQSRPMTPPRSRRRQRTRRAKSPRRRQWRGGSGDDHIQRVQAFKNAQSATKQRRAEEIWEAEPSVRAFKISQSTTRMAVIEQKLSTCLSPPAVGTFDTPCKNEDLTQMILEYNDLARQIGSEKRYCNRTSNPSDTHIHKAIPVYDQINLQFEVVNVKNKKKQSRDLSHARAMAGLKPPESFDSGRRPSRDLSHAREMAGLKPPESFDSGRRPSTESTDTASTGISHPDSAPHSPSVSDEEK
jgi:hypothetical protein